MTLSLVLIFGCCVYLSKKIFGYKKYNVILIVAISTVSVASLVVGLLTWLSAVNVWSVGLSFASVGLSLGLVCLTVAALSKNIEINQSKTLLTAHVEREFRKNKYKSKKNKSDIVDNLANVHINTMLITKELDSDTIVPDVSDLNVEIDEWFLANWDTPNQESDNYRFFMNLQSETGNVFDNTSMDERVFEWQNCVDNDVQLQIPKDWTVDNEYIEFEIEDNVALDKMQLPQFEDINHQETVVKPSEVIVLKDIKKETKISSDVELESQLIDKPKSKPNVEHKINKHYLQVDKSIQNIDNLSTDDDVEIVDIIDSVVESSTKDSIVDTTIQRRRSQDVENSNDSVFRQIVNSIQKSVQTHNQAVVTSPTQHDESKVVKTTTQSAPSCNQSNNTQLVKLELVEIKEMLQNIDSIITEFFDFVV
jgi:hypothetical protein